MADQVLTVTDLVLIFVCKSRAHDPTLTVTLGVATVHGKLMPANPIFVHLRQEMGGWSIQVRNTKALVFSQGTTVI